MKPILHYHNENNFDNNGIGVLSDCTSLLITEELNGKYELVMKYPIDGVLFSEIKLRSILVAKPNKSDKTQPFRVYRITKPLKGIVTIYAEHISYDLSSIPVSPFSAEYLGYAVSGMVTNSEINNPFYWDADNEGLYGEIEFSTPRTFRSMLMGDKPSILTVYDCEFHFDRFGIYVYSHRGADRGVQIRYGKNLIDLKQEENISKTYTGIYPYYTDGSGNAYVLPEKILYAEGDFEFTKILPVDLTNELGDVNYITEDDFREVAKQYMVAHEFGKPTVSINVSFIELADTEEYKDIALLESVDLGDTVEVIFDKLGISSKARVVKTVYNGLTERYDSVTIGEMQGNIADSIASAPTKEYIQQEDTTNRQKLEEAIRMATELLNGANGGVFEILDENGDGINDAWILRSYDGQNFIKATKDGIGLTTDGGKSFRTAMTPLGINADVINAGKVLAEYISGDGLDVSNATIENCEITENCKIYGTVLANKISSYSNKNEGHNGSVEYTHSTTFDVLKMLMRNSNSQSQAQIYVLSGNLGTDPSQSSSAIMLAENYVNGVLKQASVFCQDDSVIIGYTGASIALDDDGVLINGTNKKVDIYGQIRLVGSESKTNLINGNWQTNGSWDVYGQWHFSLTPTYGSDKRIKNSISDIPEKYSDFFDRLRPVICKHNADKSDKFHVNFIAQEVLDALDKSGLSENDFAGVSENNGILSLAYTEFIPLLTAEIQKLKQELKSVKDIIASKEE